MNQSNSSQETVVKISETQQLPPLTESIVTSNILQPSPSSIANAKPFLVQNGNVYQLAGNSQVLNKTCLDSNSVCSIGSITKNVILNSIQQGGNLNQRIKMTAVKPNGTSFNLNLDTSKNKVVYRTVNDLLQPQMKKQSINIPSFVTSNTKSKQIIIQGTNTLNSNNTNRISTLLNTTTGNNKSVIVIGGQTQQNSNATNNLQYIIQQKQPVYLTTNNSTTLINNIKNNSANTNPTNNPAPAPSALLQSNKIQNILLEKSAQQNREAVQQQTFVQSLIEPTAELSNLTADSNNKNVIYVLSNGQQNQQIIKLNKPTSMPPVATNSILKAHLASGTDLIRKSMDDSSVFNSPDTNLKFALQTSIGSVQSQQLQQSQHDLPIQAFNSSENSVKSKPKEVAKITPVATNPKFTSTTGLNPIISNIGSLQSLSTLNSTSTGNDSHLISHQSVNKNQSVQIINKLSAVKNNSTKKVLKENQDIVHRRESIDQQNQLNSNKSHILENNEFDENFLPSDEFLNDLLLPDTRIFASLLNKDLSKAYNHQQASANNQNSNINTKTKTHADLTYKTVMIGNTEHIVLDNLTNLSDYRGDFSKLQTLASAVANKFNKPVTIPAFMLMTEETKAIERIKEQLMEDSIQPILIDNYEIDKNSSIHIPNSVLCESILLRTKQKAEHSIKQEYKEEQNIQQGYQQNNCQNLNLQNQHLINSLKSEVKPQQQQSNASSSNVQLYYTDNQNNSTADSVNNSQQQIAAGKDTKNKAAKARKPTTPKNPNTPKRRKTVSVKEKINQIPADQFYQQNSSDSMAENTLNSSTNLETNDLQKQQSNQVTNSAKKIRKPRNSIQIVYPLTKNTQITTNTVASCLDQSDEANKIKLQNIQIQNIANDLIKVKDDIHNLEQQQQQQHQQNSQNDMVYHNAVNFINETNNQSVVNYNQYVSIDNSESVKLLESVKKESLDIIQTNSAVNQSQVYNIISNTTEDVQGCIHGNNAANGGDDGGCSTATINEYDFNFDPFDSNVLFNLNDMEFI